MIEITQIISDIKGEFEGGVSLSIDWDALIRRAVKNVLDNTRPNTLKRTVPLYGGLSENLTHYYCPSDVFAPSDIYPNGDENRVFKYQPPKAFYRNNDFDRYTIEYVNGVRVIVIRHQVDTSIIVIDAMDVVGTKTGGTPTINEHNYLYGSAAIEFSLTDAGVTMSDTLSSAIDISDYLRGVILLPGYLKTAANLASIEIRLETTVSDYYKVVSTVDSIGDYFRDTWNFIKFEMASKTEVGSPDATDITAWKIIGTTESGETLTIIVDKFTIQKFTPFYFQYYSNRAYINGTTGALWKETPQESKQDKVNFEPELQGILHYELAILVRNASNFTPISSKQGTFEQQLSRKWGNYIAIHPSDEAPLSYSKSPQIDLRKFDNPYENIIE